MLRSIGKQSGESVESVLKNSKWNWNCWLNNQAFGVLTYLSLSASVLFWNNWRERSGLGYPGCTWKMTAEMSLQLRTLLKKVAHTRLPSIGFQSWSQFLAVCLQVTWVINHVVGCHYFLPCLQLPPQPLRGLVPISLLGEQKNDGCEQCA